MKAQKLISELERRGVALRMQGEQIAYRAPPGALTLGLRRELVAHKSALLTQLRQRQPGRPAATRSEPLGRQADRRRLSDLFRLAPVHRLRSRTLGEDVLLVADDADIAADNQLVVYRQAELVQLVGREPDLLRAIHQAKRILDGQVHEHQSGPCDPPTGAVADVNTCPACGQARWWTQAGGRRICGVCHPEPRLPQR